MTQEEIRDWSARKMAKVLEYSEYLHFLPAIEKAKEACENSKNNISYHFDDILEMIRDRRLSRMGRRILPYRHVRVPHSVLL